MPPRRVRAQLLVWAIATALAWAAAAGTPEAIAVALTAGDADVLVTDARGVIVGIGRVVAGASFALRVLDGFVGPACLTLLRPDGATEALEVVIGDAVLVEGLDLLQLLEDRVEAFTVEVGGVAYREAERRAADAGGATGDDAGRRPTDSPGPDETPSRRDAPPGGPASPGPRGSEGRP